MTGRVYKNGSAVGTERSFTGTSTVFSENFSCTAEDEIQLYLSTYTATGTIDYFNISFNDPMFGIVN
jgi:hypothetical protein